MHKSGFDLSSKVGPLPLNLGTVSSFVRAPMVITFCAAPGLPIVYNFGPKLPAGLTIIRPLSTSRLQAKDNISLPSEGSFVEKESYTVTGRK